MYDRVNRMKIAICDDENVFVKSIYNYLWQQPDCSVECFLSPTRLLEKYEAGERYDVVFLDIVMSPINGIDAAKRIRACDPAVILVFLTSYLEYAPSGYEVNAFRYLLKPVGKEDISRVMKDIRTKLTATHTLLKTPECEFLLHTQDIQYLEADNKNTILYYNNDVITLRKSLSELAAQLPFASFFRIHRKYMIHLAHVREFDDTHLTLDSGKTLPVSRRRSREFKLALKIYIEGDINE